MIAALVLLGFVVNFFVGGMILGETGDRLKIPLFQWLEDCPSPLVRIITITLWPAVLVVVFYFRWSAKRPGA